LADNFKTERIRPSRFVAKWQSTTSDLNIAVSGYRTECEKIPLEVLKISNASFNFQELQVIIKEV